MRYGDCTSRVLPFPRTGGVEYARNHSTHMPGPGATGVDWTARNRHLTRSCARQEITALQQRLRIPFQVETHVVNDRHS